MKKGGEMLHRTEIRNRMKSTSLVASIGLAALLCWASPSWAQLGTAETFGVLAGTAVTNTGATLINGDVGVSPGTAVSGLVAVTNYTGTLYTGPVGVGASAQIDLATAYGTVAGTSCPAGNDLTGQDLGTVGTLTPGVYCFPSTSAQLTGTLTLDFLGDPSAVFIFQIGTTLTTAVSSSVLLTNFGNGSSPNCNVYWQVGSSATLGGSTAFKGNILALLDINFGTGASLSGRALARTAGQVTLLGNNVTRCPVNALPVEVQRFEAE